MTDNEMQTKLEDRVHELEEEVRRMMDKIWWMEAALEKMILQQRKECPDDFTDIKLKINIDTTEAIQQLQRIQKALITDEQLEQVKQELKEYWEENIYQKNTPANHNLLPKAEKEQLEKIKKGEID